MQMHCAQCEGFDRNRCSSGKAASPATRLHFHPSTIPFPFLQDSQVTSEPYCFRKTPDSPCKPAETEKCMIRQRPLKSCCFSHCSWGGSCGRDPTTHQPASAPGWQEGVVSPGNTVVVYTGVYTGSIAGTRNLGPWSGKDVRTARRPGS